MCFQEEASKQDFYRINHTIVRNARLARHIVCVSLRNRRDLLQEYNLKLLRSALESTTRCRTAVEDIGPCSLKALAA